MTRRRTWAFAALVAAAVTATAFAGVAVGAQPASGVRLSEASGSNFPDMAFVLSLPKKQALTAAQLHVTENGAPVRDLSVAKPGAENVGVVLLVDASESMAGKPIAGAMAAARTFAARRNPGQQLALITFNDKTAIVLPLTSDKATIDAALAKTPPLSTGTHIYDGLARASALLQQSNVTAGSIVLISDGKDVGSTTSQETAISDVTAAKARVFAVGLKSPQYSPVTLQTIANSTGGSYSEAAGAEALGPIYAELGYTLSNDYVMRYRSLAGPDKKQLVALQVAGIPGTARATYTSPALPTTAPQKTASDYDRVVRSPITLIVIVLLIVSMLGYAIFRILYRPDQELKRRIGQFVTLPEDEQAQQRQADVAAMLAPEELRSQTGGRWSRIDDLEQEMAIAGIEAPLRRVAILTFLGGLLIGAVVAILVGSPLGLLAFFAAPLITRYIINRRLRSKRKAFSDQLPDNLDVISSGLRSGHSFIGALAVCVEDAAEPSKSEFRRVIADEQLGVPIDDALHVTAKRMDNRDIIQVALVAKLQREAGTNAADVIDQVSDNVRARLDLRRLVATLTAQGRMARWIVSLLPVLLFIALYLLNKDYLAPLWTETIGIIAMILAVIMVVIGSLLIKRIVEIEV